VLIMVDTHKSPNELAGADLALTEIRKQFGPIYAVRGVTLTIKHGEVHGLVGENGAGKSTLGKIIAGVIRPDSGQMLLDGRRVRYNSASAALREGVAIISQELAVVPQRTVAENVFLGVEPRQGILLDTKALRRRFEEISEQAGFNLPGDAPLGSLRKSEQQQAEILRALARGARLIVMDEPTAALGGDESKRVLGLARRLADAGRTIILVSHNLSEVLEVSDRVSVLRDGQLVRTGSSADETPESLVTAMIGRSIMAEFPRRAPVGRVGTPALRVANLNSKSGLRDVSLEIWPGEILGVAGLVGSGRSELARAIFGADKHDGRIEIGGQAVSIRSVRAAIKAGIVMLPERRKEMGLLLGRSVTENITLPHLPRMARWSFLPRGKEQSGIGPMLATVGVRANASGQAVQNLSGGNQQKVMFAKWLLMTPRVFLADEPTQGVDVGATAAIYDLIVSLAAKGMAVLLISSELEEVVGLAHRVLVMRGGEIVKEVSDGTATADSILSHAFAARSGGEHGGNPEHGKLVT
jgi:ABC-type sugar transport system ATPase subunit